MVKIKKTSTSRHEPTLSPMIADFVKATSSIPLFQLPAHLASFPRLWPFPRGDLYHWIPALNRFDQILELFNQEYGLVSGPQTQSFGRRLLLKGDTEEGKTSGEHVANEGILDDLNLSKDGDRELVEQIVSFTRLLLENCGNRSLYSSSGHLNNLLNTTSISLLKTTLRLSLRLAQRFHASRTRLTPSSLHSQLLASHYNINLEKVQKLALPFAKAPSIAPFLSTPFGKGKDKASTDRRSGTDKLNPADLVALVKEEIPQSVVKEEFGGVQISYYEPASTQGEGSSKHVSAESPGSPSTPKTPTPVRRSSNLGPNQTPRQPRTPIVDDSPVTPTSFSRDDNARSSGPKTFEISPTDVFQVAAYDLVKRGIETLPDSYHYELLQKIRVARALASERAKREDIIATRLLAIANLAYVHPEGKFTEKIGQQDSEEPKRLQLAYQLAELVHPPGNGESGISRELQTLSLSALEALTKHKSKAIDVTTALSVNVNHGVLFYVVRKAVAELGVEDSGESNPEEDEWREALFSLLNSLPTAQPRTGENMVSAGLLEILVEVLILRTAKAERNHPKVLNFLDTFVYNLRDAFQSMVQAKGLDVIADLTSYEVETSRSRAEEGQGMPTAFKTQLTDYQIPYHQQQTLRWLFKFMNHMMSHTGGNFDRLLRNLIDSPQLLSGLRTVISNGTVYGSTVWSMAVNILTSFIHNEPTSYQVIAEAGLSKAFLEAVTQSEIPDVEPSPTSPEGEIQPTSGDVPPVVASTNMSFAPETSSSHPEATFPPRKGPLARGILPVAEAISTIPPAYGAICLAEAGMKLFKSSNALASFFEIFESPAHIKALDSDPDIPTMIGNSFDELVRHHPPLKADVLASVHEMTARVSQLCFKKAEEEGVGAKLWAEGDKGQILVAGGRQALVGQEGPVHEQLSKEMNVGEEDVEMQDADANNYASSSGSSGKAVTIQEVTENEDPTVGPTTSSYIGVVCRFLGGFFSNNHLCASFIDSGGLEFALDFATLPCLPYKFNEANSPSEEVSRVIQLLVEQKPTLALPSLVKRAQKALDQLDPLMEHSREDAFFAPFTNPEDAAQVKDFSGREKVLSQGTQFAKSLVTVHTLCNALTLTFQAQMFNHRSTSNIFSQVNLADMYAQLIYSLGRLHRSCVWEEILLQKNMPKEWEKETQIKSSTFGTDEADDVLRIAHHERTPSMSAEGINGDGPAPDQVSGESNGSALQTASTRLGKDSVHFKNTQTLRYLLSKIPTAITPFFQSLGKLLLFRRNLETYQKQCSVIVADQLAKAAIDQLLFGIPRGASSSRDRFAYWIVILTSVSQLIIDNGMERGFPQALTLVLLSFKNHGGFAVLSEILESFYNEATSIIATQGDEIMKDDIQGDLNLSLGGIKIILAFYAQIINSKLINEAAQTTSMQSRPDRDRNKPDFFLPAQFLVELRTAVIKPVQKIWNSELMDKATTSIVKTSISILKTVLDGDTEHGAYKRSDKVPAKNKMENQAWKPRNPENVQRLVEQGFLEDLAREALYRCCDNYMMAREYCLSQNRDRRSTRNPIPRYELEHAASNSPIRADVVVPEPAEPSSLSVESGDTDLVDAQSVNMEDAADEGDSRSALEAPVTITETSLAESDNVSGFDGPSLFRARADSISRPAEVVTVEDLDDERAQLRKNLIERSLDILNSHDDVTFELSDLINAAVSKAPEPGAMRADIGMTLVQSLISLQAGDDLRENAKKIAASAHLLALVLQDKDFYDAIVEELKGSFSVLLDFIKLVPNQPSEEPSPWVGQILLIVERLLAEDELPHQIQWTLPTPEEPQESITADSIPEPIVSFDDRNQLFDTIMDILPRVGKDESLALSVTRVLVMLTRSRKIAIRQAERKNIQRLFLMVKQLAGMTNDGLRSAFMLVLRHIIEDDEIIRQIMRNEIQTMFETRDRRQTDTTGYTRQMYHLALRAPEIFVEVTHEKLTLARFDPNQRPQTLTLKRETTTPDGSPDRAADKAEDGDRPDSSNEGKTGHPLQRTKTSELKPPIVENPNGVIHYLLCELLAYKDVDDKEQPATSPDKSKKDTTTGDVEMFSNGQSSSRSTPEVIGTEQKKGDRTEFKAESHPIYIYRCFILKCLAELLHSYNRTKVEFINFSRKADPRASTPAKPRSGVLNYLLNALVPIGSLDHAEDLAAKKKAATASCAIDVVVALCAKTAESSLPKLAGQQSPYADAEPDLLFVRKFVLEHALKAFKDASTSDEALDSRYSRLLSLADMFSRMISQRPDGSSTNASELMPTHKQMAKIMYEKNFITILTTAIADIDLNFPNAKRAVKYILKPLKWLSAVAVDLSMHYDTAATPGDVEEDEISTASDDDNIENEREETPDLYRNSTLGMFDPAQNQESDSDPSDDEDDDEIYDDQYADDMEYEEEMGPDGDEVISDEDEEMGEMGPIEGMPGDMGMDVEVVLDEEGDEGLSDDEEGSEDDEDEDDGDENDEMAALEEMEDMEEINGDDENGSLVGADQDDWASEDEPEEFEDHDDIIHGENDHDHDHDPHSNLNQLMEVLESQDPSMLDRMEAEMDEMDDYLEEDMEGDGEDEDDYDEEEIVYNPGEDDDDAGMPHMGFGWDTGAPHHGVRHPHRINPWMFPGGHNDRILVPAYRSHRPGGAPRGTEDGINPLLQRSGRPAGAAPGGTRNEGNSDWVHAIDPVRGHRVFPGDGGPVSFISNLLNAMSQGSGPTIHQHNGAIHLSFNNFSLGLPPPFDPGFRRDMRRQDQSYRTAREDPAQAVTFVRGTTSTRWQEEARVLYGSSAIEKSQRVVNSLLKLMVPPAIEAAKKRQAEREAEQAQKVKEEAERRAKEQKEREEREAKEKQEREEREAIAAAEALANASAEDAGRQGQTTGEPTAATEGQAMEGIEALQSGPAHEGADSGPSEPAARVVTNIRGRELDITGLGIDLDYLEALPEELREEVLMQALAEQRSQAAAAGEEPTDISREFLEALPPEIREELLQQEAQERRRREREEQRRRNANAGAAGATAATRGPEDIDTASFLASLPPDLRQTVLMEQDEDMLAHLPPEFAVEARALGGDRRLNQFNDYIPRYRSSGGGDRRNAEDDQTQKKKARPCVQMLDKAGVATLLRLMFIPQTGSAKQSLSFVLKNVCENRQNRAEVISILLSILQDGSVDVNAVERSFAQLSLRAKQTPAQKTPQPPKRTLTGQFPMNSDVSPLTVVQQCLETLQFLSQANAHVSTFFLTEHEATIGLKSRTNRKGKAKETKATKYPLNALLGLVDRKLILESSSIMEKLASLLVYITTPLRSLQKKEKEKASDAAKEGASASTAAPPTSEQTTTSEQTRASTEAAPQALEDTEMTSVPETVAEGASAERPADTEVKEHTEGGKESDEKSKKQRTLVPPEVPDTNLRLVARILAARECNGKIFRDTLSVINHLSPVPGAKEVFGKELIGIAQDLGQTVLRELDDLTRQVSKAESSTDVQGMALSLFSRSSSDQTKLLRVFTALDYLFDPNRSQISDKPASGDAEAMDSAQKDDILTTLFENSTFGPLWSKLSECLAIIRQRGNMLNVATILLPLIETLMLVCKNTSLKDQPLSKTLTKEFALSSPPPESRMENLFFSFTEEHRKILNDLVRQNPKLMSGSFSLLVKNSKVLEFDNKRNYFNRRLHQRGAERVPHPPLQLAVRRDQVFLDSFKSLYFKSADEMKYGKLSIRFHGEEGVDAGGVTREWFQVLARQMFNPDYALFVPVASDRTTFHPNRLSAINQEHLMFFKFIGRIIGKALYEGRVLDCHFSRAVYKRILGKPVNLKDMETLDLEYYKSLLWMLENDITDIITETFSVDVEAFGETQTVDLIENGRNVPVTEENKHEYVRLVTEHRLTGSVQEQLENFLKGFHDIVPAELVSIFSEQELELLISGLPDINVDDWKNNTEYHNYTAASPQIQWFWRAVRSFDKEERAKLLQFVTGTSKVPLNGFKELEGMNGFSRFNIHRDYGSKDRLPSSHTCFNQLDLPEYETYEALRQQLYTAMTAGSEYFGFA